MLKNGVPVLGACEESTRALRVRVCVFAVCSVSLSPTPSSLTLNLISHISIHRTILLSLVFSFTRWFGWVSPIQREPSLYSTLLYSLERPLLLLCLHSNSNNNNTKINNYGKYWNCFLIFLFSAFSFFSFPTHHKRSCFPPGTLLFHQFTPPPPFSILLKLLSFFYFNKNLCANFPISLRHLLSMHLLLVNGEYFIDFCYAGINAFTWGIVHLVEVQLLLTWF